MVHYSGVCRECTSVEKSDCKFPVSKQSFYFYLYLRVNGIAFCGERKNTIFRVIFSFFFNKILLCSYLYK